MCGPGQSGCKKTVCCVGGTCVALAIAIGVGLALMDCGFVDPSCFKEAEGPSPKACPMGPKNATMTDGVTPCSASGFCDSGVGTCLCFPGVDGPACDNACPDGHFGQLWWACPGVEAGGHEAVCN